MTQLAARLLMIFPLACAALFAGDWTDYRGPNRDGTSPEKNLPERWSPSGENLAWKAPYGGRSTPVIHGNRLYVMNTTGKGATLQERVMALNADTGQLLWEHRMNVFLSDVPPHRAAWASPVVDPETGNVYAFGVGGLFVALDRTGKLLWEQSLGEEQGLVTTHGGRTVSPVVYGDLVIVSGISSGWGDHARAAHRFFAFDKRTGRIVWISSPGGRPYDTTYSPPVIADVNGMKLFVSGGGDGAVHALKVLTGEPVWSFPMSKRGINTGVLIYNNRAIVSHSEENLDSNEMGLLAAIDATGRGQLGAAAVKWANKGFQGGYSNPVMDGDRIYQIDNGSNLFAFDFHTGRLLWQQNLGTVQKASPVLADGKIYVGTEGGKFYILKPHADRCEVLSEVSFGDVAGKEQVIASAAVARGRIYVVTTENIYAIGRKGVGPAAPPYRRPEEPKLTMEVTPAHLQVVPAEIILSPGESLRLQARLYDALGRFIRPAVAQWSLEGLRGKVENGMFVAASENQASAGVVKATAEGLTGVARIRVVPPLPWSEDFESFKPGTVPPHWTNTLGKFVVREIQGNKVLVKLADNAFTKRARAMIGPAHFRNVTVEVDVSAVERRRQMGDAGVVAQRYQLALFGNHQRLELQPWQPETERTVSAPFEWKPNTWYRLKLQVENLPGGRTRARGKAWPAGEPEPERWLVERVDPIGNREGGIGIYADAPFEVYLDNFKAVAQPAATRTAAAARLRQ